MKRSFLQRLLAITNVARRWRMLLTIAVTLMLVSVIPVATLLAQAARHGSTGISTDLAKYSEIDSYKVPKSKMFTPIVGIAIAGSNDHVYVWYKDGTVSSGYSQDFERHIKPTKFTCAKGKKARDIVAMAINDSDHIYTWYKDKTVSVGSSTDLDKYQPARKFTLPPGMKARQIIDAGISKDDKAYYWFKNGTMTIGSSTDLDKFGSPKKFDVKRNSNFGEIVGIAIAKKTNSHCYAWYDQSGKGLCVDGIRGQIEAEVERYIRKNNIPGITVAASRDGKGVLSMGFGYANLDENKAMTKNTRSPIGSCSKILGALAWMKIASKNRKYGVNSKVYGPNGILKDPAYLNYAKQSGASSKQMDWYRSMTVAHLMTHTAGFNGSGDVSGAAKMFNVSQDQLTYKQIHLHFLKNRKLLTKPGTKYSYSNHGMGLMGLLVQEATGKPFATYVRDNILKPTVTYNPNTGIVPFRTKLSQFDSDCHAYKNFATGNITTRKIEDVAREKNQNILFLELPAGGWSSTAGDLVKVMLATDQISNHADILPKKSLKKMERPFFETLPGQGLGWHLTTKSDGSRKVAHGGARAYGNAYMAKFLPGYKSGSSNLGKINIAICINIDLPSGADPLSSLADQIAFIVSRANIRPGYDIAGGL